MFGLMTKHRVLLECSKNYHLIPEIYISSPADQIIKIRECFKKNKTKKTQQLKDKGHWQDGTILFTHTMYFKSVT